MFPMVVHHLEGRLHKNHLIIPDSGLHQHNHAQSRQGNEWKETRLILFHKLWFSDHSPLEDLQDWNDTKCVAINNPQVLHLLGDTFFQHPQ